MWFLIISAAAVFFAFSFFFYALKKKKPFKRAFVCMLTGVAALCAVNIFAGLTGVYIPVTRLTVLTSMVGGVPGTALLVLLSAF